MSLGIGSPPLGVTLTAAAVPYPDAEAFELALGFRGRLVVTLVHGYVQPGKPINGLLVCLVLCLAGTSAHIRASY
jgi:hypothetical protein